jgi:hypothetical protein
MAKATETVETTAQRPCRSAKCRGKVSTQRLIKRVEEGQPVRKVWECQACRAREQA